MADQNLKVSLESHLKQKLVSISPLLPSDLKDKTHSLLEQGAQSVPYSLLLSISQWSRRPEADKALSDSQLEKSDYLMVSLLAGTISSPEGKFGTYMPPKDPEEVAAERAAERRVIVTLINAVLTVAGATFAAFWAADKTGWKEEWKVLFALFVMIVVASSEAILYIIWSSRRNKSTKRRVSPRVPRSKKIEPDAPDTEDKPSSVVVNSEPDADHELRRRIAVAKAS